jgi:uncharacterized delta-60 repeat protein
MIGKFINPIASSSSAPPTPSAEGIYIAIRSANASSTAFGAISYGQDSLLHTGVSRLNSDLTIDSTFSSLNYLLGGGFFTGINSSVELPDGKILIAGSFGSVGGVSRSNIAVLNADGSLSSETFTIGSSGQINKLLIQPDGKILVGGNFTTGGRLTRLNADLTVDTGFNVGTGFSATVRDMVVQSDGKIIVVGEFTSVNSITANRVARLNSDGSVDGTFNTGTGANGIIRAVDIDGSGNIYICGEYTSFNGNNSSIVAGRMTRLTSTGSIDLTFSRGDAITNGTINDIKVLSDGGILVVGGFVTTILLTNIIKYNFSGSRDTSFVGSIPSTGSTAFPINGIFEQDNGKILLTGNFGTYNGIYSTGMIEINLDGTVSRGLDFEISRGSVGSVVELVKLSTGKFLIFCFLSLHGRSLFSKNNKNSSIRGAIKLNINGDYNDNYKCDVTISQISSGKNRIKPDDFGNTYVISDGLSTGTDGRHLLKTNSTGTIYDGFNYTFSNFNDAVLDIDIKSNSLFICGRFTFYKTETVRRFIKTDLDGNLDVGFNNLVKLNGPTGQVNIVRVQNDGKILIAGDFSSPTGKIARFNSDGSLDSSFVTTPSGFNGDVDGMEIDSNGKIVVFGVFSTYRGVTVPKVARLNPDGSLDSSFTNSQTGTISIESIAIQPDNKVLAVGNFTTFAGITANRIVRLNTDGSVDSSFITGDGFNSSVNGVAVKSDGTIYVVGSFVNYNGNNCGGYCVLGQNGSFIPSKLNITSTDSATSVTSIDSIFIKE